MEAVKSVVEDIKKITKKGVYLRLQAAGIQRGSGDWQGYVDAKRIVIGDHWLEQAAYRERIGWICDYIGL